MFFVLGCFFFLFYMKYKGKKTNRFFSFFFSPSQRKSNLKFAMPPKIVTLIAESVKNNRMILFFLPDCSVLLESTTSST